MLVQLGLLMLFCFRLFGLTQGAHAAYQPLLSQWPFKPSSSCRGLLQWTVCKGAEFTAKHGGRGLQEDTKQWAYQLMQLFHLLADRDACGVRIHTIVSGTGIQNQSHQSSQRFLWCMMTSAGMEAECLRDGWVSFCRLLMDISWREGCNGKLWRMWEGHFNGECYSSCMSGPMVPSGSLFPMMCVRCGHLWVHAPKVLRWCMCMEPCVALYLEVGLQLVQDYKLAPQRGRP